MVSKMKINQAIKYIFVDYFDTTCFRHIHSSQIYLQWAKVMRAKFPELGIISNDELVVLRHMAHHKNNKLYKEKPYLNTMSDLYDILQERIKLMVDRKMFVDSSYDIDVSVEIGCQYGNPNIVNLLRQEKKKGKKIFLVSDFYLPMEAYHDFLVNLQSEDLFDKVYVSESFNKTKAHGDLYDYILKENSIKADEVVMIGDSKHSDVRMAREHGLYSIWYFPLRHKLWTNFSRLTKRDFSNYQLKKRFHELFHHSKKAYDAYQKLLMPLSEIIKTHYFLNSRKVVFLAKDAYKKMDGSDETDFTLQKDYLLAHSDHGKFYMVDEGWYNHSQQMLTEMLNIETFGYYIGSCRKEKLPYDDRCHRKGLLFEMRDDNKTLSPFFGIFCTNRSMYEQLLSAPHGSVRKYKSLKDGEAQVEEKYDDKEKYIYDTYTRKLQDLMLVNIKGLTAWNIDSHISLRLLSRLLLKSALFNSRKRCRFLNDLDRNMVDNCGENQSFQVKGIKDVRINVVELLLHPANYLGMLAKVQRKIVDKSYLMPPYYILASFAYFYIRFLNLFENEDK